MKENSMKDYLPIFKHCTLSSEEITAIVRETKNENIAALAFESGKILPEDVKEIIELLPENSYKAFEAAMAVSLTPEQQLEVIATVPSFWRYLPAKRAIELDCDSAQILKILKLLNGQFYEVAPTAIQSGKLSKAQMFEVLDMVIASLESEYFGLATETATAMIENGTLEDLDIIKIIKNVPAESYFRRVVARAAFKQNISVSSILSILDACKEGQDYAAIAAIETKKLSSNEIVKVVKDYGKSNWLVIEAAIETEFLSPDQATQIFKLGKQIRLDKFEKERRLSALKKARLKGFALRKNFWGKWRILND